MDDKYNVKELHEDLYDVFLGQDYENEYFDVTFFVEGKELYAHGQTLAAASPVFKKQLLQNRRNPNKLIQIDDDFTYDEFFEFLRLIYFDFFQVAFFNFEDNNIEIHENIFVIYNLANIYKAERIKKICDDFYMDPDINDIEHIFECIKLKRKYSWEPKNGGISETILYEFLSLIEFDGFIHLDKSTLEAFVYYVTQDYDDDAYKNEKLYETIYKWGEYQAMITVKMQEEEKNQLILHHIKDILPMIKLQFEELTNKFLFEFAVPKDLISYEEAEKYKMKYIEVCNEISIHNKNPQSIYGSFIDDFGIYEEYLEYTERNSGTFFCSMYLETHGQHKCYLRNKKFAYPSKPSTVEKMKGCEWYLLLEENGKLALKHHSKIEKSDYLIAEMKSKTEFSINEKKFVEVFVSHERF